MILDSPAVVVFSKVPNHFPASLLQNLGFRHKSSAFTVLLTFVSPLSQTESGSEFTRPKLIISCLGNLAETWNLMFHLTVFNPRFFIQECPQSILFPHNYPKKDYTCIRRPCG